MKQGQSITIGHWEALVGENDVVTFYRTGTEDPTIISVHAGEMKDLVAALLIANPGENPRLRSTANTARDWGIAAPESVRTWANDGRIPGLLWLQQKTQSIAGVVDNVTKEMCDQPVRGNPDWIAAGKKKNDS